jgi:cytidine deaminase
MKATTLKITIYHASNSHELAKEDATLLEEALKATRQSYAPYSHFNVGAAVLLENGEIVQGSNQENAAYPSGLCAERVALFYANSRFPNIPIRAIAITSAVNNRQNTTPAFPCGSCRQVLLECETRQQQPIRIIMGGSHEIKIMDSSKDLLPLCFEL